MTINTYLVKFVPSTPGCYLRIEVILPLLTILDVSDIILSEVIKMQHAIELPSVEFITTNKGEPKSVIVDVKDWQRIVETLKIISSKKLRQSIAIAKKELHRGAKLLTLEETFDL